MLVCPGCRTRTEAGLELRTLEPDGDERLACACGKTYDIVRGVPIVTPHPPSLETLDADRHHLAIYLDAHWGDRAEPPPDGPAPTLAVAPFLERIAALPPVADAVELGCSTGRVLAALARRADHAVGVELNAAALAYAHTLLAGGDVPFERKRLGAHFTPAIAHGERTPNVSLVCGDALDPPLVPHAFDRVVALNLIDSVPAPRTLLSVLDGLCAPGGELVLASPYAWSADITPDPAPLDGPDPAAQLRAVLTAGDGLDGRYDLLDDTDLRWTLRRDARSAVTYEVHYVRARKRGGT
jgi:SAM-dependent methyltransferase